MATGQFDALDDAIDRKVQQPMLRQPALQDIKVICNTRDNDMAKVFMDNIYQACQTFKYDMNRPDVVTVNSNNFRDWENAIKSKTSPQTRLVVLILSGPKGKGTNYNELKRLLKTEIPIPSQVILTSTLKKDKGVRSVINKVLIQMCAKIGGEPWAIDNLPFTSRPTMVMGIDVYQKRGINYIGCAASCSKTFTQFFTIVKETESDVTGKITECIAEALAYFAKHLGTNVQHLILLRDGLTPSRAKDTACTEYRSMMTALGDTKITYILLNKKTTVKLFHKSTHQYVNIPPGTMVDNAIVEADLEDFYLVSQKSTQGLSQATHYTVLFDTADANPNELQSLVYKLCFLYCNWNGAIKIPAPVQYAKKAAMFMGDKLATGNGPVKVNERFNSEIRSLYYV
jgi:aubergine-like protein